MRIAFLLFDGVLALDVVGPADVFAMANRAAKPGAPHYEVQILSMSGGLVRTSCGMTIGTQPARDHDAGVDTLMVPGGSGAEGWAASDELVEWIRGAAVNCRRVCSVCTGAFLLAEAGLLDGRRAVTHWDSGAEFTARFPAVHLDQRPIYIRDGRIWTSAGVTAGIDLSLALVEQDLGRAVALAVAKRLVVFLHRPGGQAQFSTTLAAQAQALAQDPSHRFYELHAWVAGNLAADLSVEALAQRSNMSSRSFARSYTSLMGTTPAKAIERARLEAAKQALERGDHSIKRIATSCGFGDEERLRRAFRRGVGVSPDAYRERFAGQHVGAPESVATEAL